MIQQVLPSNVLYMVRCWMKSRAQNGNLIICQVTWRMKWHKRKVIAWSWINICFCTDTEKKAVKCLFFSLFNTFNTLIYLVLEIPFTHFSSSFTLYSRYGHYDVLITFTALRSILSTLLLLLETHECLMNKFIDCKKRKKNGRKKNVYE